VAGDAKPFAVGVGDVDPAILGLLDQVLALVPGRCVAGGGPAPLRRRLVIV